MKTLEFWAACIRGLIHAARSDVNVALIFLAGLLGGRKGLGTALLFYVAARRVDGYARLYERQTNLLAASNQVRIDGRD